MSFRTKSVMVSPRAYAALRAIGDAGGGTTPDEVCDTLLCRMVDEDKALQDLARLQKKAMDVARDEFRAKHPDWQPKITTAIVYEDTTELP